MPKRKVPARELPEDPERILDQTTDFEIIVEAYLSNRSITGTDLGYGIRNKKTGVVEMRWGAYSEALQGLTMLQGALDRFQAEFVGKQKRLN